MPAFEWVDGGSGFLDVADARLEYACHGPSPENAMTIVMLHEGLGSVSLWKDFPKSVAEQTGFGVLVYSRRGYGNSSSATLPLPLDYMTREALDYLPGILDQTGIRRAMLLGHSDGATISAIYAGSKEDFRVRGLVLIAPHFFTEPVGLKSIRDAREAWDNGSLREKLARHHGDVENAFLGWNGAWLDPRFEQWNVSEVIDYLRIPVLALQGREDEYGTLAQIREIEERSYAPVDVVILDQCGHSPHRDRPEDTLAAISDFAERLSRIEAEAVHVT